MIGAAQFGIVLSTLGVVLTLMGLFPGVTGIRQSAGVGAMQVIAIMIGFTLLITGALIYVKGTFYPNRAATLSQQIGVRIAATGLILAAMIGLADFLGFGSHTRTADTDVYLGWLQALGVIFGFLIAAGGVLMYAWMGEAPNDDVPGSSTADEENPEDT